jgi:hypothetical protein
MNPKKSLPKDSVELERQDDYILIQHTLNKLPYYTVFRFFETTKGTRYIARGASNVDLERVRGEFERITGKKLAP